MKAAFNFKTLSAASVRSTVERSIEETRRNLSNCSSLESLDAALTELYNSTMPCCFLRLVSTDAEVRSAAAESFSLVEKFELEVACNRSLYRLVKEAATGNDKEASRSRELYLRDFELKGAAHLPELQQEKVRELRSKIVELSTLFQKNVADDETCIYLSREELNGLDDSFLGSLECRQEDGLYKVTLQYPHSGPVMRLATSAETRKKLWLALGKKAVPANLDVLPQVISLRLKSAQLLGFESDAALCLAQKQRMAGDSVAEVEAFMEQVRVGIEKKKDEEMAELREANGGRRLAPWDLAHVNNQVMRQKYQIDHEKIKEYFPVEQVLQGVLGCYSELLGVQFTRDHKAEELAWHEAVHAYQMTDAASGEFLARFYLDLHPRQGKYTHAACWWFRKRGQGASESYPSVCMVSNFTEKTDSRPALLQFSEVETFFHEFGHVCHACLSQNRFQRLNWTWKAVEMDVLEIPSMCFQKFVFDTKVLARLSRHYQTGESLPDDLRRSLLRVRNADDGRAWTRLINMAQFDFMLHSSNPLPSAEWAHFQAELTRKHFDYDYPVELEHPGWCTFEHMVTAYNAGYYSYLWSEVVAADIFSAFEKHGNFLDPELGSKMRRAILEPCARDTGKEMVANFLGRDMSIESFLKQVYHQ